MQTKMNNTHTIVDVIGISGFLFCKEKSKKSNRNKQIKLYDYLIQVTL